MIAEALSDLSEVQSRLIVGLAVAVLSWTVWRAWAFSVYPWLHPQEPLEYPYLIPGLGHALGFFHDSNRLITDARKYFGNKSEIFAISAVGERTYVLTSSTDVTEAYRNTDTLSFNIFVQQLMRWAGNSEGCVQAMYTAPEPDTKTGGFPNPHGKPLGTLSRDLHIAQLFPGEHLTELMNRFIAHFEAGLRPDNVKKFAVDVAGDDGQDTVVPLMSWILRVFSAAGQEAYFGKKLGSIYPNMVEKFLEFDDLGWQVLYQYPRFLSRKMHGARDRLVEALEEYFNLPLEKRDGAAWFVPNEEAEMRRLGINTHDIAVMMVVVYWAINTNTPKACFWLVADLLHNPSLLAAVRTEIGPAFANGQFDLEHINDKCPLLSAAFNETLRLFSFSGSVRFVTQDMLLGGKLLRPGSRLLIAYRQLHFDEDVFGADVASFDADRFLADASRTKSSKFRPFGGGHTQCPGRFVARQSALAFAALLIHHYDVQPLQGQQRVEPDLKRPVLGMAARQEGAPDLMVQLRKRA